MIIIGAGSAGLFYAIKRAESNIEDDFNENITIYEEHKRLGSPVQCTGLLTDEIENLVSARDAKRFTVNRISSTTIHSPNRKLKLNLKENLIIDNVKFVEYLAEKARKLDIKIETEKKYIDNTKNKIRIKDVQSDRILVKNDSTLIGADGPMSPVAFHNNLYGERQHLLGIQARVKMKNLNKKNIDFFPYIGEYAWSVPENDEITRVGLAIPLEQEGNKNKIFNDLLKKFPGTILEKQGGLIPVHSPRQKVVSIHHNFEVALVGDAALQIKNTTGGGIIPGMKAALELSKGFDSYERHLKPLNKELYWHYALHKSLRHYSEKDWDRLLRRADNEYIKRILLETSRDNAKKMMLKIAMHPSMWHEGLVALMKMR
jgi:digeranylgeranylglycerophospholipid reductase